MIRLIAGLLTVLACSLTAAEQLLFTDSFKDGSLKGGTVWNSAKSKEPWTVKDNFIRPSGKIIFDTVSTKDFKPVENTGFTLKLMVKFVSATKTGDNRFTIMMRDSAAGYSGYGVTISQGTSNNSNIETISKGKRAEIFRMPAKNAYFFTPGKAIEVIIALTDGVLTVAVDGKEVMQVKDTGFKRFDTLQIQERCKTPEMIQELSSISLYTNNK